jgi:uncharacterized protein YvpB
MRIFDTISWFYSFWTSVQAMWIYVLAGGAIIALMWLLRLASWWRWRRSPLWPPPSVPWFWRGQLLGAFLGFSALAWIFSPTPQVIEPSPPLFDPMPLDVQNPLIIKFDRPLNQYSLVPILSPGIAGQWVYNNDRLADGITFFPAAFPEPGREYTVSLSGIKNYLGFSRKEAYLFVFKTSGKSSEEISLNNIEEQTRVSAARFPIGPLWPDKLLPATIQPVDGTENVNVTDPIKVTFNQPIDTESVRVNWQIEPMIEGRLSFTAEDGNSEDFDTVIFSPDPGWEYDREYRLILLPGIKTPGAEAMLEQKIEFGFKTSPEVFKLKVPLYHQENKFACFSATAKMALEFYGIDLDEQEIMDRIGYQQVKRNFITNTWGDPDLGIVGTVDGEGEGGYGVHWGPVAKMLSDYREVEIKTGWNVTDLLIEVSRGYPVLVWWVNGVWPAKELWWKNSDGNMVRAVNGMHVEVVVGWIGNRANPDYILTNDPWRGERKYDPESFRNLWKWFGNTGVVVR